MADLFARSDPAARLLFRQLAALVRRCGPVTMIPQKTRVVFMHRVRFVAVYPRKDHLRVGLVLTARRPHLRFFKIETVGAVHVHHLRVRSVTDLDAALLRWLREAKRIYGAQKRTGWRSSRKRRA